MDAEVTAQLTGYTTNTDWNVCTLAKMIKIQANLRAQVKTIQRTVEIIGLPSPLSAPDMISIVILSTSNVTTIAIRIQAIFTMAGSDVKIPARTGENDTKSALIAPVKSAPSNIHHLIDWIQRL